jgi:hypothetical protein
MPMPPCHFTLSADADFRHFSFLLFITLFHFRR